jgi:hypothetical protein
MRRTLRTLHEAQDDWKVCDEASDGLEAVAKFEKEKFDVIVLAPHEWTGRGDSPQSAEEARKVGIRAICPKSDIECVVEGVTTNLDSKSYFRN